MMIPCHIEAHIVEALFRKEQEKEAELLKQLVDFYLLPLLVKVPVIEEL